MTVDEMLKKFDVSFVKTPDELAIFELKKYMALYECESNRLSDIEYEFKSLYEKHKKLKDYIAGIIEFGDDDLWIRFSSIHNSEYSEEKKERFEWFKNEFYEDWKEAQEEEENED